MPPKPSSDKPKRGRKPKAKEVTATPVIVEETPVEPAVTEAVQAEIVATEAIPVVTDDTVRYNHYRYHRCTTKLNTSAHPAFLHNSMVCNTVMQSYKTTDSGKMKHYKCPRCGAVKVLEGVEV